jgi:hypothetical protein
VLNINKNTSPTYVRLSLRCSCQITLRLLNFEPFQYRTVQARVHIPRLRAPGLYFRSNRYIFGGLRYIFSWYPLIWWYNDRCGSRRGRPLDERMSSHRERVTLSKRTHPPVRLIKMERCPRRILLFKLDDVVLEELEPIEECTRW